MTDREKRFGIPCGIAVGAAANLALFDLDAEWTVDPGRFLSKGRATPFEGWRVSGRCLETIYRGDAAYRAEVAGEECEA